MKRAFEKKGGHLFYHPRDGTEELVRWFWLAKSSATERNKRKGREKKKRRAKIN